MKIKGLLSAKGKKKREKKKKKKRKEKEELNEPSFSWITVSSTNFALSPTIWRSSKCINFSACLANPCIIQGINLFGEMSGWSWLTVVSSRVLKPILVPSAFVSDLLFLIQLIKDQS